MKGIKKGKSLCIYSPKGGVGKTTLCMNLAGIASLKNKKVLIIDCDMFNGGMCLLVDENINKTIYTLTDDIANNRYNNISEYVYKYNDNIDILCSPKDPRQGTKIDAKYIKLLVERTLSLYDLILIDTSSVLDEITLMTLDISEKLLFVIANDLYSIKNMRNIINILSDNGFTNYKVLYNTSFDSKEEFYSPKNIESLIDTKIDYILDKSFFIKSINKDLYNYTIPVLANKNIKNYKKGINCLNNILEDIFKEDLNGKEE